jgi:hypothetical protein
MVDQSNDQLVVFIIDGYVEPSLTLRTGPKS